MKPIKFRTEYMVLVGVRQRVSGHVRYHIRDKVWWLHRYIVRQVQGGIRGVVEEQLAIDK